MLKSAEYCGRLISQSGSVRSFTSNQAAGPEVQVTDRPVHEKSHVHYKDWPNAQGFDTTYEEREPIELQVEGTIPVYAAGVLFRTGLGPRSVDCGDKGIFRTNHWFDNFAQVHRFHIHAPSSENEKVRVTYNSRLTSDGLIEKVRKTGKLDGVTFAAKYEPCKTFFQKLQSWFEPATRILPQSGLVEIDLVPNEVNIGVTMSINFPGISSTGQAAPGPRDESKISSFCTRTDANMMQMLDSETLEPIGIARQTVLHPELKGPISSAHAKTDPVSGHVFNFNLQFTGRNATYRIFRTSATTGQTTILATIYDGPAYMHSIWLTENYLILCRWNSYFIAGGAYVLFKNNLVESMEYNDRVPAKWYVVDKRAQEEGGHGVIATYDSAPFFAFHTVNAYEDISEDGTKHIVADIPVYQNLEVLKAFYLDNILSDSPKAAQVQGQWGDKLAPRYRRYRLPDIPEKPREQTRHAIQEFELSRDHSPELPSVNYSVFTKKHRYVYGVVDSGKSTLVDSILKLDLEDQSTKVWSVHGQTAGEPVFIADPDSTEEDGGVLLSVLLDGIAGRSYLLVLDAKDLSEVGRAIVEGVIGFGFHGIHAKAGLVNKRALAPNY